MSFYTNVLSSTWTVPGGQAQDLDSRSCTVVAAWNGMLTTPPLPAIAYGTSGHLEYRRSPVEDFLAIG